VDGVNTYFVAKVAAETGLKVAISGLGADEIFGGYPTFRQVPRAVLATRLIPFTSTIGPIVRKLTAPIIKHFTSPKYASLFEYGGSLGGAYFLRRALFMPWETVDLLDGEILKEGLQQLGIPERLDERISAIGTHYPASWPRDPGILQPRLLRDTDWQAWLIR